MTARGAVVYKNNIYHCPMELRLYDSNSNVLATATVTDIDHMATITQRVVWFANDVRLTAGAQYRLTLRPTATTASDWRMYKLVFVDANARAAIPYGDVTQKTSRTDLGAWTNTPLELYPWLALVVNDIQWTNLQHNSTKHWYVS